MRKQCTVSFADVICGTVSIIASDVKLFGRKKFVIFTGGAWRKRRREVEENKSQTRVKSDSSQSKLHTVGNKYNGIKRKKKASYIQQIRIRSKPKNQLVNHTPDSGTSMR